jgi:phage baseplate assembly protein W
MGYGSAIGLTEAGDLEFDPNTNTFTIVTDLVNLTQAIKILLKTLKGEIRFYPDFGLDIPQLLDKNISDDNLKHAIVNSMKRDPRIRSVDGVDLVRDRRNLSISMRVTTFTGAVLDFRDNMVW